MAFSSTTFFAVAHKGTEPQLIAPQTGGSPIDAGTLGVTGFNLIGINSLHNGAGGVLTEGSCHLAFSVTWSGAGDTGTLAFSQAGFNGLPAADQDALAEAFASGGTMVLSVDVLKGAVTDNQALTVWLGALHTSDFIVNTAGTTATAAHHPGAANPNFVGPTAAGGTYTFLAPDLNAATNANANTLAIDAGATPPTNLFNRTLTVAITAPAAIARTFNLPINLNLRTELVVSVDRSGSMGGSTSAPGASKWEEAVRTATLMWNLYGESIPPRTTAAAATVAQQSLVRYGRWRFTGGVTDVTYEAGAFEAVETATDPDASLSPGGGTPIGDALKSGEGLFTSGKWVRRHLLLLTDGMDNSGTVSLSSVVADYASHLPVLSASAADGVIVHTVSFAQSGETPVEDLGDLAGDHGGVFHGSASDRYVYDVDLLRQRFIQVLGRVVPVELTENTAGDTTFDIEDGVDRVVFIAPDNGAALSATHPSDATDAAGSAGAFRWARADRPEPGVWTVAGAAAGARIYAVYDVALRLGLELLPQGLGRPIKVRATLDFRGQPVSGADVRAGLRRPGESIGEVITSFIRSRGLASALTLRGRKQLLHPDLAAMLTSNALGVRGEKPLTAATVAKGVSSDNGDTKSLQRLLLEAAERARNLEIQSLGNPIALTEVSPGVYEGEVPASMTQEVGVYDFALRAEGVTPGALPFKRSQRSSLSLAPIPNAEQSEVVVSQAPAGNAVLWSTTVLPRTVTGRALGPGVGYALSFQYAQAEDRKKLPAPLTIDNLDGSYSAHIQLPAGQKLPPLALVFGRLDDKLSRGMIVEDKRRPRKVRVRLDKVQVLDDKDGCLSGAGELVFDAIVAPNGNPARAVRTRLPAKGVLKATSGQEVALGQVIYEGLVEASATLSITLGGRELDYLLFFQRQEKLARYHRDVPLRSAQVRPDDEPNDPESLRDWKVWYTVEVE